MTIPHPAFALLGTPHSGRPPRIVPCAVREIYAALGCAALFELGPEVADARRELVCHILPLSRVASLQTLAAKRANFAAMEPRPPLAHSGNAGAAPQGMTGYIAAPSSPETATQTTHTP